MNVAQSLGNLYALRILDGTNILYMILGIGVSVALPDARGGRYGFRLLLFMVLYAGLRILYMYSKNVPRIVIIVRL